MTPSSQGGVLSVPLAGYVKQSSVDAALSGALGRDEGAINPISTLTDRVVEFDFSNAKFFDLGALMWLVPVMSRIRSQGNLVRLKLPDRGTSSVTENLWSMLQRWRYFDVLEACVDDLVNLVPSRALEQLAQAGRYRRAQGLDYRGEPTEFQSLGRLEISVVPGGTELEKGLKSEISTVNGSLARSTLRLVCGWTPDEVDDFVSVMVPHALRNVGHGRGSFALVGMRPDARNLHFIVADNGLGIPGLLKSALSAHVADPDLQDSALIEYFAGTDLVESEIREILDSQFVRASTEAGVTSSPGRMSGVGLYYLKRSVVARGGELRIRSGTAVVTFDAKGTRAEDDLVDSPGTTVRLLLPIAEKTQARMGRRP